ncbi:GlsB/YeaQ/YmgE family stress response membrane protein [Actinoplanes flavus]|uniref:GlsB/YeaQ/YmgE family stress response membrane protein n=1 Tax=Actinoplanes flavus TaxID=2820290 RepID=A0ABS3UZZ8_9ACTN|nr:GlsB/YeaQ/YmgE family stress response membrane protein [Actinoplanes flavus]MBO3744144.1 GlsB/YeaQ/YmgE family stress response membrane protein [Actinoplanes flavus]
MTARSLFIAVAVGVVTGVVGRLLAGRSRSVPVWLPIAAGVAAAMLATVLAWMSDVVRPGLSDLAVVMQVLFAAAGVAIVVATADRPAPAPVGGPGRPARKGRLR